MTAKGSVYYCKNTYTWRNTKTGMITRQSTEEMQSHLLQWGWAGAAGQWAGEAGFTLMEVFLMGSSCGERYQKRLWPGEAGTWGYRTLMAGIVMIIAKLSSRCPACWVRVRFFWCRTWSLNTLAVAHPLCDLHSWTACLPGQLPCPDVSPTEMVVTFPCHH